jgi:hypothetical protein
MDRISGINMLRSILEFVNSKLMNEGGWKDNLDCGGLCRTHLKITTLEKSRPHAKPPRRKVSEIDFLGGLCVLA